MRHRKSGSQLARNSSHRRAMLRNMVTALFKYENIQTTDAKAKAIRPVAEKMIGLAKRGDLHARRQALAYMKDKTVTHRLFDVLKDRYTDRQGGYLRIVKIGSRKGDGAAMSIVQLLAGEDEKKISKKSRKLKSAKTEQKKKTAGIVKKVKSQEKIDKGTPVADDKKTMKQDKIKEVVEGEKEKENENDPKA